MRTQTSLINLADQLSSIAKKNKNVTNEITLARERFESRDDPSVQLYGLSQAGKSTFLSCLTLGEQFIPIGTGTATTAVVVELFSSNSKTQNHAEVRWLNPVELQELAEQPLRYFLDDYAKLHKKRNGNRSDSTRKSARTKNPSSQVIEPLLSSREYREHLWRMLTAAKRAREAETHKTVGKDNDLAITEIVLRHYERYSMEYGRGFQQVLNLAELSEWTRQPIHWGEWDKKPLDSYEFSEIKSFFTKTVRLHTTIQRAADGLTIFDTPGFGISNIHDRICRSAQLGAEAVFLIVGQQIGQEQMREMQQLSAGLKDNLFVIWNSKDGTNLNAQDLLDHALIKLRNEAGIIVPKERTAVANLHLALRAMQWQILQAGGQLKEQTVDSLKERFSRIYRFDPSTDKIEIGIKRELRDAVGKFTAVFDIADVNDEMLSEALTLSGWNDVVRLLNKVKEVPTKQKQLTFALSLATASIRYLEGFPTAGEIKKINKAVESLSNISDKLMTSIVKKNRRNMEDELESDLPRVFREFLDYLTETQELKNLKVNLAKKIEGALHYSTVPAKLIAGTDDYVRARSGVWLKRVLAFETNPSKDCILEPYKKATREIGEWIRKEWSEHDELNDSLELPAAPLPILKLDDFRQEFINWNKVLSEKEFSSGWIDSFLSFIQKGWGKTKKTIGGWLTKTKNYFYGTDEEPPEEKPSFNQDKAVHQMKEKIDDLFSKRSLEARYELGKDQTFFFETMSNRQGQTYETFFDIIDDYNKTQDLNFLWESCDKLFVAWYNASDQLKRSLDTALDSWLNSIEPILKERIRNLSGNSPEPALLETLIEIEQLFDSSNFAEFEDATLISTMSQLNRVVAARKTDRSGVNRNPESYEQSSLN